MIDSETLYQWELDATDESAELIEIIRNYSSPKNKKLNQSAMETKKIKTWKKNYTWVLVANAIYILIFCLIMKLYA